MWQVADFGLLTDLNAKEEPGKIKVLAVSLWGARRGHNEFFSSRWWKREAGLVEKSLSGVVSESVDKRYSKRPSFS